MAKIDALSDISNLETGTSVFAANNDKIEEAFDNTVSRDGSSPNQMEADFDMNGNRVLNLPAPASDFEPVRLIDFAASGDADALELELASTMTGEGASKIGIEDVGGNYSGATVETALAEVMDALDAHKADPANAHTASAITNVPAGGIGATDVQAAITELDTEKASVGSVSDVAGDVADVASDLSDHISDPADAHAASAITNDSGVGGATVKDALDALLAAIPGVGGSAFSTAPLGSILPYAGASAPTAWMICDGTAISRTTYAALFAIAGTSFGVGDGSTTFNLPDLRGRVPMGSGTGSGLTARTRGASVGAETHALSVAELPAHHHAIDTSNGTSGAFTTLAEEQFLQTKVSPANTEDTGSGTAHTIVQPSQVTNFIIKVEGEPSQQESIILAASDETTALTTGTSKVTFRMPYAFTLSAVRASLSVAQASGSIFTVDINDSGTTILSTKITIDNTEKTSTTATAAVISDTALADDAEITIDIDQVGDGTAKGLKVTLIGTKT